MLCCMPGLVALVQADQSAVLQLGPHATQSEPHAPNFVCTMQMSGLYQELQTDTCTPSPLAIVTGCQSCMPANATIKIMFKVY